MTDETPVLGQPVTPVSPEPSPPFDGRAHETDQFDRPDVDDTPVGDERSTHRGRRPLALGVVVLALVALVGGGIWWSGRPDPPPPPKPDIPLDAWAPYWTLDDSIEDAAQRIPSMREISPFWYEARGVDSIGVSEFADAELVEEFMSIAESSGAAIVPSVVDLLPAGEMAAIIADADTRTRHVDALVAFTVDGGYDGIDINYEQFAFADGRDTWATTRPNWVAFIEELSAALDEDDRTLTVSIPPVYDEATYGERGYWVYDHGTIIEHLDALRIMAYDFSVPDAGPIAPLGWVEDVITGVSLAVPEEHHDKLVLGVPSYGSNWVVSTVGECPASAEGRTNVTARSVDELAARRNGVPEYDPVTGEWSFAYALEVTEGPMSCIQNRKVHWVDAEGVAARTTMAREAGWGGVSLWALGYEDAEVWNALVNAATLTVTTEPTG